MLRTLINERDQEKQRGNDLHVENLRLQLELDRYRKWYYGPRADRLQSSADLAQMLLTFAEEMDRKPGSPARELCVLGWKPVNPDDLPPCTEPAEELRRVKRRKGRRNLANFENLPVTTQVHELSADERACPCCGVERKEIGADESWQVEYLPGHFEPGSPRTGLRPWGGNASIICARSMPARAARAMATIRGWRRQPSRIRQSKRAWPGRGCWLTSQPANSLIISLYTGWKTSFSGKGSISRERRSRSDAEISPIWPNHCGI
jgi:hypothetical protein